MRVERAGVNSGLLKRSVVVIYWIALPLCLLASVGFFVTIQSGETARSTWFLAAGSLVLAALIVWRLWLRSKALKPGSEQPSGRRLLLVVLPLALLALAGMVVLLLGVVWIGIGGWMLLDPTVGNSVSETDDDKAAGLFPIVCGLVVLLVGAAMNVPLVRLLKRRPTEILSPNSLHDLEPPHD